jgi:hypothetical protein
MKAGTFFLTPQIGAERSYDLQTTVFKGFTPSNLRVSCFKFKENGKIDRTPYFVTNTLYIKVQQVYITPVYVINSHNYNINFSNPK